MNDLLSIYWHEILIAMTYRLTEAFIEKIFADYHIV